mmetsp:Transcript_86817/g.226590  ORF Transcript_86817/g.226590 Transcript_86817/m.226590 type:complete len:274 (-) Transcript_86817:124-945(-)
MASCFRASACWRSSRPTSRCRASSSAAGAPQSSSSFLASARDSFCDAICARLASSVPAAAPTPRKEHLLTTRWRTGMCACSSARNNLSDSATAKCVGMDTTIKLVVSESSNTSLKEAMATIKRSRLALLTSSCRWKSSPMTEPRIRPSGLDPNTFSFKDRRSPISPCRNCGKDSSRRVCPVGAVSITIRSKLDMSDSPRRCISLASATASSMPGGDISSVADSASRSIPACDSTRRSPAPRPPGSRRRASRRWSSFRAFRNSSTTSCGSISIP